MITCGVMTASGYLVKALNLEPHPEGGYYREFYRCAFGYPCGRSHSNDEPVTRSACTAIYYLLEEGDFSAFHRMKSDEIWHFYQGGPMQVHQISPEGEYSKVVLGFDIAAGQAPAHVVPAGHWLASEPCHDSGFSLVGCTVSPGFEFSDLEMATSDQMVSLCKDRERLVKRLIR